MLPAASEIEDILKLVKMCPEPLQEKCFDILLNSLISAQQQLQGAVQQPPAAATLSPPPSHGSVPDALKGRFAAMASRLKVSVERLGELFDFSVDPFTFHAAAVPGASKKEMTRNAALLLGAKSYLAGGGWGADWLEFKAMCVDQNCYDRANNSTTMKHDWFKTASSDGITLSSSGTAAAEILLGQMLNAKASS